jgi:hypothetical protein
MKDVIQKDVNEILAYFIFDEEDDTTLKRVKEEVRKYMNNVSDNFKVDAKMINENKVCVTISIGGNKDYNFIVVASVES